MTCFRANGCGKGSLDCPCECERATARWNNRSKTRPNETIEIIQNDIAAVKQVLLRIAHKMENCLGESSHVHIHDRSFLDTKTPPKSASSRT